MFLKSKWMFFQYGLLSKVRFQLRSSNNRRFNAFLENVKNKIYSFF